MPLEIGRKGSYSYKLKCISTKINVTINKPEHVQTSKPLANAVIQVTIKQKNKRFLADSALCQHCSAQKMTQNNEYFNSY